MAESAFSLRFRATKASSRPEFRAGAAFRAPLAGETGRRVVRRIRFGSGSLDEQIRRRAHIDRSGIVRPWKEPMVQGREVGPDDKMEGIFWRAALGQSGAGSEEMGPARVAIVVNDSLVRREAAQLGNQIVSSASYFPFVTGGFDERLTPERSVPTKPSRSRRREFVARFAMWWYLGLTWGVWLTEAELRKGVLTPPKNLGFNPTMMEGLAEIVLKEAIKGFPPILGGLGRDPGRVGTSFPSIPGGVERV